MWTEHRLLSFDETPLFYRVTETVSQPRAIVIILHGMGEHGGRYGRLADFLARKGIRACVPDLRGFGRSGGKRACVRDFSYYQRDLAVFHEWIRRTNPSAPLFILGHSFGGLVTSSYLAFCAPPAVQGLVLSSPIFGLAVPVPWWKHVLGIAGSYLAPDFSLQSNVTPDMLTRDPQIIAEYNRDPLIYKKVSGRLYRELRRMMGQKVRIARAVRTPVLIVRSGRDLVVRSADTDVFFKALGSADKELEVYDDAYHEVFNELGRERVFSRVADWLENHLPRK